MTAMRLLVLLFATLPLFAQTSHESYPRDYFRSPLDIPLYLSGSFGELRNNHFHSGLDFRTQQKEGFNVYAAADGYVSRIKISPYGYGKALYIDHPNGYTTVYGHLQSGSGAIEAYIKSEQYRQRQFEIEVFPKPGELVVKKGDVIALSGNTGGSGGPHLHFEIRDTKSEKIINPMFFGFDILVGDTRPPSLTALMAYPIGPASSVNQSQRPLMVNLKMQEDGSYIADRIEAMGKIGFAIGTYDQTDNNNIKTGVYKVQSFQNGTPAFGYEFDTFAFDESRYVNALLDYPRFKRTGMRLQKLFREFPYGLSVVDGGPDQGIVTVLPDLTDIYRIEISDFNGNRIKVHIPIDYVATLPTTPAEPVKTTPYFLKAGIDNLYKKDHVTVSIPARTFYEDFYLDFSVSGGTVHLHDDSVPVHRNFSVSITDDSIPESEKDKTFIASVNGNRRSYNATKWEKNTATAYTKDLGDFVLARDTDAPVVKPVNFKEGKWISKNKTLELSIRDGLSGIRTYEGYLNGNWILLEYDYKTRTITHDFGDGIAIDGRNDLKVVVSDNVGNSAIFETWFFRSVKP